MSYPQTISFASGSWPAANSVLNKRSTQTDNTKTVYELLIGGPGGPVESNGELEVRHSTDSWHDAGISHPGHPTEFDVNGVTHIKVFDSAGNSQLFTFIKPSPSTSGEGSTIPAGTVEKVGIFPNATVKAIVNATSPSSSGVISYELLRDGVVQPMNLTGHNHGTPTQNHAGWHNSRWELRMVSTTGLYETAILAYLVKEVNVSCNFW